MLFKSFLNSSNNNFNNASLSEPIMIFIKSKEEYAPNVQFANVFADLSIPAR